MVEITVNENVIPFKAGDRIDLGDHGLIVWYGGRDAEATEQRVHAHPSRR